MVNIPKKEEITLKNFQKLVKQNNKLENEINLVKEELSKIKNDILSSQERIEQTIKTQEEIIMDMIKKFNDELFKDKTQMKETIEKVKTQQDVLRISYTINEKKLMDKVNTSIVRIVNKQIDGKESEVLMKIWINELKEITENFDKLKILKPKEFSIRLNEISDVIEIFKQKIQG